MNAAGHARAPSLRRRLLAATLGAGGVALLLAGVLLAGLFRDHVASQFAATLVAQLDQVTARLEFDAAGEPRLDARTLSDPRWSRPYSGLYWQVDAVGSDGTAARRGALRSRSLWDAVLQAPADRLADGAVHVHEVAGPSGEPLLLVERTVRPETDGAAAWRLVVAGDLRETEAAVRRFNGVLAASLGALGALLAAAGWAQVAVGLAPLRRLQQRLAAVREGRAQRLDAHVPLEVRPLVDDFNAVLDRNAEIVERARTQAGNLAHAVKTPLAAMRQAAASGGTAAELAALVREQVDVAQRHVDWHLARSRAAATQGLPGTRTDVAPVVAGLLRVMAKVHAERGLAFVADPVAADCRFAGEAQDLQEMLGNVLDNACKWARREVHVAARTEVTGAGRRLVVMVEDDGPGIAPERLAAATQRGARLDESVPGSGLGLAIVDELVRMYGGRLALAPAPKGGLRVELTLPAA